MENHNKLLTSNLANVNLTTEAETVRPCSAVFVLTKAIGHYDNPADHYDQPDDGYDDVFDGEFAGGGNVTNDDLNRLLDELGGGM